MTEHPRRPIVTYETYQEAERAVDHVSDQGSFVQRVAIIGHDGRLVEHVIGRVDYDRDAWHEAASGALPDALISWLCDRRPGGPPSSPPRSTPSTA